MNLIAHAANVKETTLHDTLQRIRPILTKWLKKRPRPQPLDDADFAYVALLLDSVTIEVYRPFGRFNEVKPYFDGKNCIYGLKVQVSVFAKAPHYALFFSPYELGSKHDYVILKEDFADLVEYLRKTNFESNLIPHDDHPSFGVLMDRAYYGPETDTPGLRKVLQKKGNSHPIRKNTKPEKKTITSCRTVFWSPPKAVGNVSINLPLGSYSF